jgi:hypothetical protein
MANVSEELAVIERKLQIGYLLIQMLAKDPDPRAPEVAGILEGQVEELRKRLEGMGPNPGHSSPAIDSGEGEGAKYGPEDVVVGLKRLSVKAKRL